ncbi:cytochrome P450 [Delitschia confertaspora ATCC 74209]|uniref:Cytochrome P450 n=1 Tax=Delitschia confertaspora ATCC 74209 TaxID=1513339 RepID=A0A9P4MLG0_9PLEO|nr:cytochrome P450 [Delitschia confertaspora ATCC 74209]
MGEELYVITSPEDVLAVYKDTTSLDFDPIIRDIMADFGLTRHTLDKMFDRKFGQKHWMDLCHADFKLQMHPGEKLEVLQSTFLGNIDKSLQWSQVSGPMVLASSNKNGKTVSLWKWCGQVLVDSATRAFFGDAIYRVAPDLLADFFLFDNESWKLSYKYPRFAAPDMYKAKAKGEAAFAQYLALPQEQRQDASWIVKAIEQGIMDLGVEESSQAAPMLFVLYRLINTNAYKLCFWCLAYLLHDPALLTSIEQEIAPAFQPDGSLSMLYLLENCPFLASFYEEILRIANDPIGTRLVVRETTIGGKTLLPGRKILMPYKLMHFDPTVFGDNASEFDPRRFVNNKHLVRSTSYRPFGGAATQCPGRFLARREVYMFVALVLHRFDLTLVGNESGGHAKFPNMDLTIPSGGVMGPIGGEDVIVKIKVKNEIGPE